MLKLGMIGAGNMGQAILRGAIEGRVLEPREIVAVDVDATRRDEAAALGVETTGDASAALAAEQLLLAVKPQGFAGLAGAIGWLAEPRIVISIMAGLSSERIVEGLGPQARVIRVMPNTPCRIGAGMTAIAPGAGARPGDERLAEVLFAALGRTVLVDEEHMHAVTAVSGSGPAYVFLLAEAMERAAVDLGLPPQTAATLVRQTIHGAGRLLAETDATPETQRHAVTSPGGTTEAAIALMLERGLPEIVEDAVLAARNRGFELDQ